MREKIQYALTLAWINKFPILQSAAPCDVVASVLTSVLGPKIGEYVYVDFASGAGGPTPFIEKQVNAQLQREGKGQVQFVLSDISPHVEAWQDAARKSANLHYISGSVDASAAAPTAKLLRNVPNAESKGIMRLFSLAFHHFDDELGGKILKNTIETSDGFW